MTVDVFISHHTDTCLHIVEAIVNKLEREGLRCWYAPRNTEGPYADSITRAIRSCKIFLLILNRQSSESVHVLNELDTVTKRLAAGEAVSLIPFLVSNEDISLDAQYYLGRFNWIDATTPPMYKWIDELTARIIRLINNPSAAPEDMPVYRNTAQRQGYQLIEKIPQPADLFVGREELLLEISKRFSAGDRILFLEGIGGIGKTELAKQYAAQNRFNYDRIVFITYLSSLRDLVCDQTAIEIAGLSQRPEETTDQFFIRKLQALRMLLTDRSLIIIDNYGVDTDPDFSAFVQGQHRVLITTRNVHPAYPSIKIGPISDPDVMLRLFALYYGEDIAEEDLPDIREVLRLIENHTYTAELLARQMEASFMTGKELLNILEQGRLANGLSETITGRRGNATAFEHIKAVFTVNQLSNEEMQVMREMALMGPSGLPALRFKEWANLPTFDLVNGLIHRSWIRKGDSRRISLHPLVQEVVREVLRPDAENCHEFLYRFCTYLYQAWYRPYTENLLIKDAVLSVAQYLQPFDISHACMWASLPNFLWQVGEFDASIHYQSILFDACLATLGEASMITGFIAKSLAGCYFNSGRIQESVPWYERGLQCMLAAGGPETEDLAMAYEKVARCATWEFCQDFAKAENNFEKALAIRKRLIEKLEAGENPGWLEACLQYDMRHAKIRMGETYMEMGRMYQAMGEYHKAWDYADQYGQLQDSRSRSNMAYSLYDKGVCHYHLGLAARVDGNEPQAEEEFSSALQCLTEALDINMQMRGSLAIDTLENQELIADTLAAMRRYPEAANAYTAALSMAEKLFGEDHPRAEQIKQKMDFS